MLLAFFTGDAAAQLYYLIVYLQLVLLTPLLYRLLAYPIARALLYAVTPTALLIRYDFSLVSVSIPIQEFFGFWLIFYLLGLEWRSRISPWLDSKGIAMPQAVMIFVVCIALQEVEGFLWLSLGNFDLATTQLKVTSALSSIAVIAVLMRLKDRTPHWLEACRPLTRLGDVSFGVYLCHMVPVMLWGILLPKDGLLLAIARWAVSLVASTVVTMALHRVLPRKISVAIGF